MKQCPGRCQGRIVQLLPGIASGASSIPMILKTYSDNCGLTTASCKLVQAGTERSGFVIRLIGVDLDRLRLLDLSKQE